MSVYAEIDYTVLTDAIAEKNKELVEAHIQLAEKTIEEGSDVHIIQRYSNVKPDLIEIIKTQEQLDSWKKAVQERLNGA